MTFAGLDPVVVELQQRGDELCTNVDAMREAVERLGKDAVAAVVTTTSCFAPRSVDGELRQLWSMSRKHLKPHNSMGMEFAAQNSGPGCYDSVT